MGYERRQYGYLTTSLLLVVVAMLIGFSLTFGDPWVRVVFNILISVHALLVLLFMSLTVVVDPSFVRLSFGVGLIRRKISMERIESAIPVRNSWWYGLGIRLTPHGWMWNIQGLDAVELTYTDGGRFRIGTQDPAGLSSAINEVLSE